MSGSESVGKNVFRHYLVPKFRLLTEEEAKELEKKLKTKLELLPHILASDPVAKYLNAKPGSVIEFIRESPTAGKAVYYRYVVRG